MKSPFRFLSFGCLFGPALLPAPPFTYQIPCQRGSLDKPSVSGHFRLYSQPRNAITASESNATDSFPNEATRQPSESRKRSNDEWTWSSLRPQLKLGPRRHGGKEKKRSFWRRLCPVTACLCSTGALQLLSLVLFSPRLCVLRGQQATCRLRKTTEIMIAADGCSRLFRGSPISSTPQLAEVLPHDLPRGVW